ncbi:ABC transporter permease [Paenibacillus koleovorans]|uniref:ABC transporter permease n=1 Tax=Paenibacillus koleovorans TaxID=121608 RepID=UPI000FD943E9|nr:ABC transporter permease subunit [Paenibacillus koleovorans]
MKRKMNYMMNSWELYVFILPAVILTIIFKYLPIYGVQIAFRKFSLTGGFLGGDFNGLDNFIRFFNVYGAWDIIRNTLTLSFGILIFTFPLPIILALMLHQVNNEKFKKIVQSITYSPHLISIIVIAGMLYVFLSPDTGIINLLLKKLGAEPIFFLGLADWVQPLYIISDIWQETGFNAVIYIAALSMVDIEQIEAATIDGVNRFQKIWHIDLPSIMPTIVVLFVLKVGRIMDVGFEKMLLLQNPMNISKSENISTYVYRAGIVEGNYSFATAVGLMNSVISVLLLIFTNVMVKKFSGNSLY